MKRFTLRFSLLLIAWILLQSLCFSQSVFPPGGGTSGTSPGAPVNSVQYNNAGSFGGSAALTWDGLTEALSPIRPAYLASPALTGTPPAYSISIQGKYAYVLMEDALDVVDITDYSNLHQVSTTAFVIANGCEASWPLVYCFGNQLLGAASPDPTRKVFAIYNVSDPTAPVLVSSMAASAFDSNGAIYSGYLQGNYFLRFEQQ